MLYSAWCIRCLFACSSTIFGQQHLTPWTFHALMAAPDDFERCNELRRWCLNHSGERPRSRSDDQTEASLARWLQYAKTRRVRSINKWRWGRQLSTKETAQLNSILRATVAPPFVGHDATTRKLDMKSSTSNREQTHCKRAAPSTSKRLRQ